MAPAAWCPVWIHLQGQQDLPAISEEACPWVLWGSSPLARGGWPSFLRTQCGFRSLMTLSWTRLCKKFPLYLGNKKHRGHKHPGEHVPWSLWAQKFQTGCSGGKVQVPMGSPGEHKGHEVQADHQLSGTPPPSSPHSPARRMTTGHNSGSSCKHEVRQHLQNASHTT